MRKAAWWLALWSGILLALTACSLGGGSGPALTSAPGSSSTQTASGTPAPAVHIATVQPTTPMAGQSVTFTANATGTGTLNYFWNYGDGVSSQGANTSHTYLQPGTYNVTVTVTDNTGLASTAQATVVVSPTPIAATIVGVSVPNPVNGQKISFTGSATGQGILSYIWDFGDGSQATSILASHAYANAGTYNVTLTVIDSSSRKATATMQVVVTADVPTAAISASTTTPDTTQPISFTASGTGAGTLTYSWNFGDNNSANGSTATHSYTATGTYTVTLTVTDSLNNSAKATSTISVATTAPSASITPPVTSAYQGIATTFTGVSNGGQSPISYAWDFGDGQTGTGASVPHTYANLGNYTVKLTVTDGVGLTSTASTVVAVVTSAATASILSTGTNPVAAHPTNFSGAGTGIGTLSYAWNFGDGGTGTGANPSHTYANTGSYTVTLVVTDSTGKVSPAATATVTISQLAAPSALTITPSQLQPVTTVAMNFTGTASGFGTLSYAWDFGDGTQGTGSTASHTYNAVGTYTVTMTVSDPYGETATATATVTVGVGGIALLAGNYGGAGSQDGTGSNASFDTPEGTAIDGSGNIYVADRNNDTIRKITPAGVVTTLAGSPGVNGLQDGVGSAAHFTHPQGLAVDSAGNVYVADTGNCAIRKILPTGGVITIGGKQQIVGSTDGGPASSTFNQPRAVAVDAAGNVYVADSSNDTIRKITPAFATSTIAGSHGLSGSADGSGAAARFNGPSGITIDSAGNLYIADTLNFTIRKMTPAGVVTTIAGTALSGGTTNGPAASATFYDPTGITIDASGNLFVTEPINDTVREISASGIVSPVAGTATKSGFTDGSGAAARFNAPYGIVVDSSDNLYVGDSNNDTVRFISAAGVVSTLAGLAPNAGSADGTGAAASFVGPHGFVVDSANNIYVTTDDGLIRKITTAGVVTTVAGTLGGLSHPGDLAMDQAGNFYVPDDVNDVIHKVTPTGVITTLAGNFGVFGHSNGTGTGASFDGPTGIVVDAAGNLYVSEYNNFDIRKITPAGVVTTFAGSGTFGSLDGGPTLAQFGSPAGMAMDSSGNLYVADYGNNTIRKITPAGVVTTFAGSAVHSGSTDGPGTTATFNGPISLAFDASGNLFVADSGNNTIREISPAGVVSTVAGTVGLAGVQLGALPGGISYPTGVGLTSYGQLLISTQNAVLITQGGF